MRVKRGVAARAKHKKILKQTKGMQRARRTSYRLGKQAVIRSLQYQYRDRRNRKRDFRRLWVTRISAAAKLNGTNYSKLMGSIKKSGIEVNRKMLSEIAVHDAPAFSKIVESAK